MSMTFEDLEAWQRARTLVNAIYTLTRSGLLAKDWGLCGQIQRAVVSIMSNVAEGFERQHAAEKLQAYNIARASAGEVRSLLYVVEDNYRESANAACELRELVSQTGALISGLLNSTRRRVAAKLGGSAMLVVGLLWSGFFLFR